MQFFKSRVVRETEHFNKNQIHVRTLYLECPAQCIYNGEVKALIIGLTASFSPFTFSDARIIIKPVLEHCVCRELVIVAMVQESWFLSRM